MSSQVWSFLVDVSLFLASNQTFSASRAFEKIQQPVALKIAITLAGLILIGLELHWFLNKRK